MGLCSLNFIRFTIFYSIILHEIQIYRQPCSSEGFSVNQRWRYLYLMVFSIRSWRTALPSLSWYRLHTDSRSVHSIYFNVSVCHFDYGVICGLFRYLFAEQIRSFQALFFGDSNQCSYWPQSLISVDSSTCSGDLWIQAFARAPSEMLRRTY